MYKKLLKNELLTLAGCNTGLLTLINAMHWEPQETDGWTEVLLCCEGTRTDEHSSYRLVHFYLKAISPTGHSFQSHPVDHLHQLDLVQLCAWILDDIR